MSIRAIELGLTGNDLNKDVNGQGAITRTFRVLTSSPADAILADGIPALRTSHPNLPTYSLDRYRTQSTNDGTILVVCEYSSDQRFVLRKPNKDDPTYYDWGWAMRTVVEQLPYWVREFTFYQNEPDPVQVYRVIKTPFPEKRVVRYLNVRIQTEQTAIFDVIAEEADTLHLMPDGQTYLFEGGNVSKVDDSTYEVTYTWVLDKGSIVPDTVRQLSLDESSPFPPDAAEAYRPAYHSISVVQRGDPRTQPPLRVLIPRKQLVGNGLGWQQLPGGTRIG